MWRSLLDFVPWRRRELVTTLPAAGEHRECPVCGHRCTFLRRRTEAGVTFAATLCPCGWGEAAYPGLLTRIEAT